MHKKLADYLALDYPLNLIADPDGGYVFEYPDLPGCLGQIETLDELAEHAEEARQLWLTVAYERAKEIPLPSYPEEYSGKFVLRLPKSLHRQLAADAEREGSSLNQYAATLLAARAAQTRVEARLDELCAKVDVIQERLRYTFAGVPHAANLPVLAEQVNAYPVAA